VEIADRGGDGQFECLKCGMTDFCTYDEAQAHLKQCMGRINPARLLSELGRISAALTRQADSLDRLVLLCGYDESAKERLDSMTEKELGRSDDLSASDSDEEKLAVLEMMESGGAVIPDSVYEELGLTAPGKEFDEPDDEKPEEP
jgi:hypothetical protein